MTNTKFHKKLGQVEIVSSDASFTVVVDLDGVEHKLMTAMLTLQDEPFAVEQPKVAAPVKKYRSHSVSASYAAKMAKQLDQKLAAAEYYEHKF